MLILQDSSNRMILGVYDDENEIITITSDEQLTENEWGDELQKMDIEYK